MNNKPIPLRVAIVGAGITGSVAASELIKLANAQNRLSTTSSKTSNSDNRHCNNDPTITRMSSVQVVIFDQGRRGPGGRASHRSVSAAPGNQVLSDDMKDIQGYHHRGDQVYQFDHGCQFFRADSLLMQRDLLDDWLSKGWVEPWKARFGWLPQAATRGSGRSGETLTAKDGTNCGTSKACDFFGVPGLVSTNDLTNNNSSHKNDNAAYIGIGGMHLLPRRILEDCSQDHRDGSKETTIGSVKPPQSPSLIVYKGTRVQQVWRNTTTNQWNLQSIGGTAAYHDTKATDNNDMAVVTHENFDVVLFTDISSSFGAWHKASAGIPDSFRARLPPKIRIPLFSCMIALNQPIRQHLPYDAFTATDNPNDDALWFAAVSQSKPGMCAEDDGDGPECWTLISTPAFAVKEIQSTTMRDETTGAFKPQENSYLNTVPGPALADAFLERVRPFLEETDTMPTIEYLQAQRWGSGLPAPESLVKSTIDICGTTYASELHTSSVVFPRTSSSASDYVADDSLGLYYAGDFCSHRNPGFEAAALSGLEAARHIFGARGTSLAPRSND